MSTKRVIVLALLSAIACLGQTTPAPPGNPAPQTQEANGFIVAARGTGEKVIIGVLNLKRLQESDFGATPDGKVVKCYTLSNNGGVSARILTYGGVIAGIKAPDKNANVTNVVACADNMQQMQRFNMQAQTIGRVANRIAGAKFTLDGKEYATQANNGPNTLHSADSNFGTHLWEGKPLEPTAHEAAVQLTMVSKDGDGGFPGTLTLKVTYSLNDDNEFKLAYEATTDKATPINVTNHAYFNLAGAPGWGNPAGNPGRGGAGAAAGAIGVTQELWIDADKYLPADNGGIPTGQMAPVKDTPFDFTKPTLLDARTAQLAPARNYDHAYVLNNAGKFATVARMRATASGREMEVRTDQPGLMLYTGQQMGVALETQHHPDSLHHDNFPSIILKPGDTFKTTTVYAFSVK